MHNPTTIDPLLLRFKAQLPVVSTWGIRRVCLATDLMVRNRAAETDLTPAIGPRKNLC